MRSFPEIFRALLLLALLPGTSLAQDYDAKELLARYSHTLDFRDGELAGEGAEYLLGEARDAQFVAIGERHNSKAIPEFTAALFDRLHDRLGFNYLILEQDPVTARTVSRPPYRGRLDAISELARRHKFAFTFISDQELAMIARAGAISGGRHLPVWGCEQAFGVAHIVEQLMPLAPDKPARENARRLLAHAREAEGERDLAKRHLMSEDGLAPKITELAAHFSRSSDQYARFLIESLVMSNRIYGFYMNGERGAVPGYYENNRVREEYMKTRCLEEYRAALKADGTLPRAVLKFGQNHLFKGLNPMSQVSLGQFMYDLARVNDMGFLSIAVWAFWQSGDNQGKQAYSAILEIDDLAYLRPFLPALRPAGWTLIDLRPFRHYRHRNALFDSVEGISAEQEIKFRHLVYGFDLVLFMPDDGRATFTATGVPY